MPDPKTLPPQTPRTRLEEELRAILESDPDPWGEQLAEQAEQAEPEDIELPTDLELSLMALGAESL